MMQKTLFENENLIEPQNPAFCIGAVSRSTLLFGDCLIESDKIESGSVDLILTDLPYGTMKGRDYSKQPNQKEGSKTAQDHNWDEIIDIDKIMQIANRILRKNGKMILTAQDPFSTELKNKAIPNLPYNYSCIWEKSNFANCLLINKACANFYEDILIFSKNHETEAIHPLRPYFKIVMDFIGLNIKQLNTKLGHRRAEHTFYIDSTQYGLCTEKTYKELIEVFGIDKMKGFKFFAEIKEIDDQFKKRYTSTFNLWEGKKYKSNIFKYDRSEVGYHPTQKPVLLLEDLIKTFSNENDLVVDLTMGSGSTGVACKNTNRNFIGIEKDENYYNIAVRRCS
jgi:site-specific DNA-methyltransferase (adenine-specific)